ncbi:MAG: YbaK/EbsC family protein [Gammaproteobacteria bacterium]|nr:YbaK/EbsC family protein [Gammaproteobacteria bacterium]
MPSRKLKAFLDEHHVAYVSISHSPAYTAQETAASAHVRGGLLAKTLMVKVDGRMAMAVVAAPERVDLGKLRRALGAAHAELAGEHEFAQAFPDCDIGAMPPFGNLYGLTVYVSPRLAADREIVFNAGTHTELVRLAYEDFERLVAPTVVDMADE